MPDPLPSRRRIAPLILFSAFAGLAGCRDDSVTAYRIPKEPDAASEPAQVLPQGHPAVDPGGPAMGGQGMDSVPVAGDAAATLLWQAPPDWRNKPASAMRKGSYSIGDAEVAITTFPGDVGGVLANVNRWRGQVGLDPVDQAGLDAVVRTIDSNGLQFVVVDAGGAPSAGGRRIVAGLLPWKGNTWFFKLTGPDDAVARAKPAFLSFLKTVRAP